MKNDRLDILFEDQSLLIVNKPSGLLTISTPKEKEKTLYIQASNYLKKQHKSNKVFIVNRLDQGTSGIVVFAKSEKVKKILQDNWSNLAALREYTAVVEGEVEKNSDIIESYLKENKTFKSYSTVDDDGKLAITKYEVLKRSKGYTLLKINLETGRKNQIRVHLSEMGNPVLGDKKYGAKTNPIRRLGLHASKLELIHPLTKKKLIITSDVPEMFLKMFKGDKNERTRKEN